MYHIEWEERGRYRKRVGLSTRASAVVADTSVGRYALGAATSTATSTTRRRGGGGGDDDNDGYSGGRRRRRRAVKPAVGGRGGRKIKKEVASVTKGPLSVSGGPWCRLGIACTTRGTSRRREQGKSAGGGGESNGGGGGGGSKRARLTAPAGLARSIRARAREFDSIVVSDRTLPLARGRAKLTLRPDLGNWRHCRAERGRRALVTRERLVRVEFIGTRASVGRGETGERYSNRTLIV